MEPAGNAPYWIRYVKYGEAGQFFMPTEVLQILQNFLESICWWSLITQILQYENQIHFVKYVFREFLFLQFIWLSKALSLLTLLPCNFCCYELRKAEFQPTQLNGWWADLSLGAHHWWRFWRLDRKARVMVKSSGREALRLFPGDLIT